MINDLSTGTKKFSQDELDRIDGQQGSEFTQGMRSGTLSMRSSLNNALGAVGNAVGATDFAAGRYTAADELATRASNAAPRVASWRDVNSLSDAGDYAAGVLGGLVPSAAVGVGAGLAAPASLGLAGAVGAGALAYTPFETGDVVGRMRDSGQEVDLTQAALAGGGSALAQSLLPGLVAGKLAGRVGAGPGAAPVTLGSAGRSMVGGAALEGGAEAGGEGIKQLGSGKTLDTLDTEALGDAAVAGAVGGSALAGVGAAGQAARQRAGDVGQGLDTAKNAATGLLARAKGGAKAGAEAASEQLQAGAEAAGAKLDDMDIPGQLQGLWDGAKAKGRDVLKRMADSEEVVGDVKAFAGAQGDKLKAMLQADDDSAVARAKQAVTDLMSEKLSPEDQAKLKEAAANLGDKANRAWVASKALATDAAKSAKDSVQKFIDATDAQREKPAGKGGPKKSEIDAVRNTVMQTVIPKLLQARPELADMDPEQAGAFSQALMSAVRDLANGETLSEQAAAHMADALGPDGNVADVLDATQRAMGELDEGQRKAFYKALLEVDADQKSGRDLIGTMRSNLVPELQTVISDAELRQEALMLKKWATSSRKTKDDPEMAFAEKRLRDGLATRYGDKADKVYAAIEKTLPKEENLLADEARDTSPKFRGDEDTTGEDDITTTRTKSVDRRELFDKNGELHLLPEYDPKKGSEYGSAAEQALRKAQAAYPDKAVRMTPASELGMDHPAVQARLQRLVEAYQDIEDLSPEEARAKAEVKVKQYGVVTVEGTKQETAIEPHELKAVKFDKNKFDAKTSKSAVATGTKLPDGSELTLDAVKLTAFMDRRNSSPDDWTEGDRKSGLHRTARMFMEGVAAVYDQTGKPFAIPDNLVIDKQGTTWGQVKGLEFSTGSSIGGETEDLHETKLERHLQYLRKMYAGGLADGVPQSELAKLKGDANKIKDKLARLRADQIREASNQQAPDPFGNVHLALGGEDVPGAAIRTNLTGLARSEDLTNARTPAAVPMAMLRAARQAAQAFKQPGVASDTVGLGASFPGHLLRMVRPGHFEILDKDFDVIHTLKRSPGGESLVVDAPAVRKELPEPKPRSAAKPAAVGDRLDSMLAKESYGALNTRAKVDAFLADARRRYDELKAEDRRVLDDDNHPTGRLEPEQQRALATLDALFGPNSTADLASFYDGVGGPPNPKAVAAKKAALLEKARSGDAELLKDLASSDDAKGLQRAAEFLTEQTPTAGVDKALDTINARLAELIRSDESVGYGLQTKRYSLMGFQLHSENQYEGFPATHDSPIRHEGKFDWRAHIGKGEGNAMFGAGTYLSTSEGTHKGYKKQFTARAAPKDSRAVSDARRRLEDAEMELIHHEQRIEMDGPFWATLKTEAGSRLEVFRTREEADAALTSHIQSIRDRLAENKQKLRDKVSPDGREYNLKYIRDEAIPYSTRSLAQAEKSTVEDARERIATLKEDVAYAKAALAKAKGAESPFTQSPTYEVSVNIPTEQLLDWNKPLSEQSVFIRERTLEAIKKHRLDRSDRMHAEHSTGADLYKQLTSELGSQAKASDYLQSLGILGNVHDAQFGGEKQFRNYVIYDDSKIETKYVHFSAQAAPGAQGPVNRKEVHDYIGRVLGPKVQVAWAKMAHAGEFERVYHQNAPTEDIIRLSVHSLNPLSTAYHESLHAFFARLGDIKQGGVIDVVNKAASSASVMSQLHRLLANEPAALKQLNNAEERAAYMYQFWAAGQLTIGPATQNVFQKIAGFVRSVLGTWSNDQRALHILEYFHQGDFAKDSAKPFLSDTVQQKLLAPGRNEALQNAKRMTKPFREFGEALAVAGGTRMRETGVPALEDLANAMKLKGTEVGADTGFLPAARAERARVMNDLGVKLKGMSEEVVSAALQSLQSKSNDAIKALASQADRGNAYTAKAEIRKVLDGMYGYMVAAGVKVGDLGVGKDYFPRAYDMSFISSHQAEFKALLVKHGVANPERVAQKLMVSEGAEFTVEVDKPGMQHLKPRVLAHIPDNELAPFMRKNVLEIMSSYVTQATRRAEWARRFGDDGSGVTQLLTRAEREGATPEQLAAAQKFVRSVDGTLGDTISPEARRLMGNMIVYQNIRLLPLAVFSSVVDPMGVMVRGGSLNDAFSTLKRGVREVAKNFKRDATDDDMTKLAAQLGTIDDASLTQTLGALYSQGMVGDTGRKINDAFFRYNLMEQFGTSMRVGATEAALNFLAKHADGKASPHSRRWLNELGLQPGQVQLDANGRVKLFESDGLTLQQSARMKAAVNRWVDGAVLRPDAVDKPLWMSDPHFALIAHLKQFVFSFHETILKRVAHEYEHGNYAPAMALASYVPIMIASDLIKGLIQGGGDEPEWKQNWTLGDYVASGVERAGLYGTGQFAVDMMQDVQRGGSGIGGLLGPTVEQLTDAMRVVGGRGEFGAFALKSMPANALYSEAFGGGAEPVSDARVSE